jgi:hypothetical protein
MLSIDQIQNRNGSNVLRVVHSPKLKKYIPPPVVNGINEKNKFRIAFSLLTNYKSWFWLNRKNLPGLDFSKPESLFKFTELPINLIPLGCEEAPALFISLVEYNKARANASTTHRPKVSHRQHKVLPMLPIAA